MNHKPQKYFLPCKNYLTNFPLFLVNPLAYLQKDLMIMSFPYNNIPHKYSVKPYRYLYFQKEEIEKIVEELLSSGMIRPNQSPYSFPILLVRKLDGTWCTFVDQRALNKMIIKDKFLIPIIEELLYELSGSKLFSKLDFQSKYHQIQD